MKKILLIIALSSFLLFSGCTETIQTGDIVTPKGQNLLKNPGFETDLNPSVDWRYEEKNNNLPHISTANYYSGLRSVTINVTGTTKMQSGEVESQRDLVVTPNAVYTISAMVKTQGIVASGEGLPSIIIKESDSSQTWLREGSIYFVSGTTGWTHYSKAITMGSNTKYVFLEIEMKSGYGTFWVDDVSLIEGTSSTPTPTVTSTVTATPTVTPTPTSTVTSTPIPTVSSTQTPTPAPTPTPIPIPTFDLAALINSIIAWIMSLFRF